MTGIGARAAGALLVRRRHVDVDDISFQPQHIRTRLRYDLIAGLLVRLRKDVLEARLSGGQHRARLVV